MHVDVLDRVVAEQRLVPAFALMALVAAFVHKVSTLSFQLFSHSLMRNIPCCDFLPHLSAVVIVMQERLERMSSSRALETHTLLLGTVTRTRSIGCLGAAALASVKAYSYQHGCNTLATRCGQSLCAELLTCP